MKINVNTNASNSPLLTLTPENEAEGCQIYATLERLRQLGVTHCAGQQTASVPVSAVIALRPKATQ